MLLGAGLADWDYKNNRMPCSLVNDVVTAYEAEAATKFVMKVNVAGRGVSAEFAVRSASVGSLISAH